MKVSFFQFPKLLIVSMPLIISGIAQLGFFSAAVPEFVLILNRFLYYDQIVCSKIGGQSPLKFGVSCPLT